jgi:hypothetical protein
LSETKSTAASVASNKIEKDINVYLNIRSHALTRLSWRPPNTEPWLSHGQRFSVDLSLALSLSLLIAGIYQTLAGFQLPKP